jgi:hypothetical protein
VARNGANSSSASTELRVTKRKTAKTAISASASRTAIQRVKTKIVEPNAAKTSAVE